MIYPKFIKENDCIGVIAPSNGAKDELKINKYNNAKKNLESLGYRLELSKNIYKSNKARSADKLVRAKEVNSFFDSDCDVIMCASGGEFLVEILPYVDFSKLVKKPKYVCGFSDPTGLLFPITTKYDIATIYGQNFSSLGSESFHKSELDFLEIIKGNLIELNNYDMYEGERGERITGLEGLNLTDKVKYKEIKDREVELTGRIIGGCFDIISELCGTKYDGMKEFNNKYGKDGIIWYFDNCELSLEETIRTLWKLNEFDYFKYAKCVIFGRFGNESSCLEYDVKSCLLDSVLCEMNIPVIYDTDFSHKAPCLPVINGSIASIKYKNHKFKIKYELR